MGLIGAVATVCVALPAAAGGTAARGAATTFQDSTGEDPQAPDITTVVASNTGAGLISFQINIPNRPALSGDMLIGVNIDSDNNPATGDQDPVDRGADYAIELFQGQVNLFRWDGTAFSRRAGDPPQASLVFSYARGATIRISAAELGGTRRLNFTTIAISGIVVNPDTGDTDFSNARADFAPDLGHGFWSYRVSTARLRLVARRFRVGAAAAGRLFTVGLVAARTDTGAVLSGGQVTCRATIGGARISARTHRFVGKEGRCGWTIPSGARGSTIRGSITVQFEGLTVRRSFSATIR